MRSVWNSPVVPAVLDYPPVLRRMCLAGSAVATIITFLQDAGFDQNDITAMSMALDEICKELRVPDDDNPARRVIAEPRDRLGTPRSTHSHSLAGSGAEREAPACNG
jgi:hypothetical protein